MSKKKQRQAQQAQQTADAQRKAQATEPTKATNTPEPSADLIGKKVGILVNEVVGAAEAKREHLETATFVQRFNVLARNHHPRLNLLAVVVSDGSKAPRKANVLHESNVVTTWEPGDHRNGAGADLQEPVVDNVLQEGYSSLAEQRGEDPVKPEHDNGLTISEAGGAAQPVEGQADSAVVEIVAPIEPQVGAAPNDMKLADEKTVLDGAVPAVDTQAETPNPEQQEPVKTADNGLAQTGEQPPAEQPAPAPTKSAEEQAAEDEAKRASEQQQQEEQK